jgi:hypothetical protein
MIFEEAFYWDHQDEDPLKKVMKIDVFFIVNISWIWEKRHRSNTILSINYKSKINSFIWGNDHLTDFPYNHWYSFRSINEIVHF